MGNPFNIDKDAVVAREKAKKEIDDRIKSLAELGSRIISSKDGAHYKAELEKQRDDIIKLAIRNNEPDPIKYAFACKAIFTGLGVLYGLLESVEKDAKGR